MAYLKRYNIKTGTKSEIIELKDSQIIEENVEIFRVPEGFRLIAYKNIVLQGFDFEGQRLLENAMSIWLSSGNIYYFYDEDSPEKENVEGIKEIKCEMSEHSKAQQYAEFWKKGKYAKSLQKFAGRFVAFSRRRYGFSRSIFYKIESGRAIPVIAVCRNLDEYDTPKTVLRGCFFSQKDYVFNPNLDTNPSVSMLENNARYVFCAPIIHGDNIIALFYCDSQNVICDDAFEYLSYISKQASSVVASLTEKEIPALKEVLLNEKPND